MKRRDRSSAGWNRLALAAALVGIGLLTAQPAAAGTASVTKTWYDVAASCWGLICIGNYSTYTTLVEVNYYSAGRDEPYHVVYWQRFNATDVRTGLDWYCRPHTLTKGATYYKTSTGNVSIGGWYVSSSSTTRDKTIKNYFSDADYALTCNSGTCTGMFTGIITIPNQCIPATITHITDIKF